VATYKFKCGFNYLQLSLIYVEDKFRHDSVRRAKDFIDNSTGLLTQRWNCLEHVRPQKSTLQKQGIANVVHLSWTT